jgi:hypothetical protein
MNEPDIRNEGPTVNAQQYIQVLRKLVDRMAKTGLGRLRIVAPDVAGINNGIKSYLPELMAYPVVMSKIAHFGLHSYSGGGSNINTFLKGSAYPKSSFWMTEWNAWRTGLDAGQTTEYNYKFASECVNYLLQLIKNGASAGIVWEGYDSYYEHPPSGWSLWGILGYDQQTKTYTPRKHFYAISQISKFVLPGSRLIATGESGKDFPVLAFNDTISGRVSITGINTQNKTMTINGELANLPVINNLEMFYTDSVKNLYKDKDISVTGKTFKATIPAKCIFTLTGKTSRAKPEPSDWYSGDAHIHRNCGNASGIFPDSKFPDLMEENDLAVISILADMGNGEAKPSKIDLPKVNGLDAPESRPGRIVHWDAEWHYDPAGVTFENKTLGGHVILLGLKEAHQIWDESPYKILEWAKKQNAIGGFCHMQYLTDQIPNKLNCCIPIDYPVEAALGTIDFLMEDVWLNDAAVNAYYKLLNCGFRFGWIAGTDFTCPIQPLGSLLTYVQVKDKPMTYRKWLEGIKNGRTVVALNGHAEFLDLKVNGKSGPGDEIKLKNKGTVTIDVKWTAIKELTGRIELVCNGKVVASQPGTAKPGEPIILKATQEFTKSGWICARRMDEKGHQSHTAAVYITVKNKPVRASAEDAQYFVRWIDNILVKIEPGGSWNQYFTSDLDIVQKRYQQALAIYKKIGLEAIKAQKP